MAIALLDRFIARAPAPVFPVVGEGGWEFSELLNLREEIALVSSPRHAAILLLRGKFTVTEQIAIRRIHDQLPFPRATVCWGVKGGVHAPYAHWIDSTADPVPTLCNLYQDLRQGRYPSDEALMADQAPHPWQGRGDHGQGGEGMMGGAPYGRPMAMPAEDCRDGLSLDASTVTVGPFLPAWPPGLILEVTLQGDVIQSAEIRQPAYLNAISGSRARQPLFYLARVARLLEMPQLTISLLKRAQTDRPGNSFLQKLRRRGLFAAIPNSLGKLSPDACAKLGLNPATQSTARQRVAYWAKEVCNAHQEATTDDRPMSVEPPLSLPSLLAGLEWHEARLLINSFDCTRLFQLSGGKTP